MCGCRSSVTRQCVASETRGASASSDDRVADTGDGIEKDRWRADYVRLPIPSPECDIDLLPNSVALFLWFDRNQIHRGE